MNTATGQPEQTSRQSNGRAGLLWSSGATSYYDGIFIKHRQGKSSDAEIPFTLPRPIAETTFTPPRPIAQPPFFLQESELQHQPSVTNAHNTHDTRSVAVLINGW